jgi:hypothetical protein
MPGMTATLPEHKAARPKFDENLHPRDRKGRFIEKGATVSIWGAGGTTGTVERNLGGGRIAVKRSSDGKVISVHRNYLTVQARPDGAQPTDKPEDAPADLPEQPDEAEVDETDEREDLPVDDPIAAAPDDATSAATTKPRRAAKGTRLTRVTLPDGTFEERQSKSRAYSHAVAVGPGKPEDRAAAEQRRAAEHERVADEVEAAIAAAKFGKTGTNDRYSSPEMVLQGSKVNYQSRGLRGGSYFRFRARLDAPAGPDGRERTKTLKNTAERRGLAYEMASEEDNRFLLERADPNPWVYVDTREYLLADARETAEAERESARKSRERAERYSRGEGLGGWSVLRWSSRRELAVQAVEGEYAHYRGEGHEVRVVEVDPEGTDDRTEEEVGKGKTKAQRIADLKADLLRRAEAEGVSEKSATALRESAERDVRPIAGTALFAVKGGRGEGFSVRHLGTGLGMSLPTANLKSEADAVEFGKRLGALRSAEGAEAFPDTADMGPTIQGWRDGEGRRLLAALIRERAAFDTERGYTGTWAQQQEAEQAQSDARARAQAEADAPLLSDGYTLGVPATEMPDGADLVIQMPEHRADSMTPGGGQGPLLRAQESRGRFVRYTMDGRVEIVNAEGRTEFVRLQGGSRYTRARVFSRPNDAPMPGEQRETRGMTDGGEAFEVVPVADLKPGDRIEYREGQSPVLILSREADGTDQFGRAEIRFQGRREDSGAEGAILFGPTGVARRLTGPAPAGEPAVDLDAPVNLRDLSDDDLTARDEAIIAAARDLKRGDREGRDRFIAMREAISAERNRRQDEAEGVVRRDTMTNPEAIRSLVAALPEAQRGDFADLGDRVADFETDLTSTSLPERPRPGEDGLDPDVRARIQRERDAAAEPVEQAWANLDDDFEALRARLAATDDDAEYDLDRVIDALTATGNDSGFDMARGERRRRRAALRERSVETLRAEYAALGLRDYDEREDYQEEFNRRGLQDDGTAEPRPDADAADRVSEAADAIDGDSRVLQDVRTAASVYADEINEDRDSVNAGALAADLEDVLDAAVREADNQPEREALEALRATILPEHRVSGAEIPGQTSLDDDLTDEPALPPRPVAVADPAPAPTPEPDPAPITVPAPAPAVRLEDSTWGDLLVGDRFVDSSGEGEVVAINEDGSLEVRRNDGLIYSETGDPSEVVQIARTLTPSEIASMVPPPAPHDRRTVATSRPSLPTSRRRIINGYALDTDPAQPEAVRTAAARIRARQPLSADESAALAAALRGLAEADGTPERRRTALLAAVSSLEIASTSAAVNLGGRGRKRPAGASLVRRLVPGSRVRIPATQGYPEIEGTIVSIRQEGRTAIRTFVIQDADGRRVERSLLGGTYVEAAEGMGVPDSGKVAAFDVAVGDVVDFGDGVARTITGRREIPEDPDMILLTSTPGLGDRDEQTLPFGRAVVLTRRFGPEVPEPTEEEQQTRQGTAAEIGVGDLIAGTFGDTGNPYIMRVTEVVPILGGSHYRVTGESHLGRPMQGNYEAGEAVTFLPPLPEDKPIPTPAPVARETIGRGEIKAGDRISIPNTVTGRDVSGIVEYVEDVEGEGDDGEAVSGVRVGLFNGFTTTTYDLYGDEAIQRTGNAGADYVRETILDRRSREIGSVLRSEADKVEAAVLAQINRKIENWRERRDSNFPGSLESYLDRERVYLTTMAARGQGLGISGADANQAMRAMVGNGATPEQQAEMKASLQRLFTQIGERTFDRALQGIRESGIDDMDYASGPFNDRLRRLQGAFRVNPFGIEEAGSQEEIDTRRRLGVVNDYTEEMRVLARTAPVLSGERVIGDVARREPPARDDRPLTERLADYKAALPAIFGTGEVEVTGYATDFDLAALQRGEAPETTTVRRARRETAPDGGPTEATLAQLEVLRSAGREIAEEIDLRVRREIDGPAADEIEAVRQEVDDLSKRITALGDARRDALISERTGGQFTSFNDAMAHLSGLRTRGETPDGDFMAAYRSTSFDVSQEPDYAALLTEHDAAAARLKALRDARPGRTTEEDRQRFQNDVDTMRRAHEQALENAVDAAVRSLSSGRFQTAEGVRANGRFGDADDANAARRLLAEARDQASADPSVKAAFDRLREAQAKRDEANRAQRDEKITLATARARATAAVIAEFREVGPRGAKSMRFLQPGERAESVKALRWAEQHYPTDWLEKAAKQPLTVKTVKRGYYSFGSSVIALSPDGSERVEGAGRYGRVSLHELGHHMERHVPGLAAAEDAFLWSRTTDEGTEIGARTRAAEKNRKQSLGYRSTRFGREVSRRDDFLEPYTGKEYQGDSFEVFQTGIESIFGGSPYIYDDKGQADEDFRAFMLGTLALL